MSSEDEAGHPLGSSVRSTQGRSSHRSHGTPVKYEESADLVIRSAETMREARRGGEERRGELDEVSLEFVSFPPVCDLRTFMAGLGG